MENLELTNAEKVGMILYNLRSSKNLNKRDIAIQLNMPYTTYNNYETGRTEPNIANMLKLADKYDVTLDYLVGRDFANDFGYMSEDEKGMIRGFRQLNKINQVKLLSQLEGLLLGQE